MSIAPAAWSPHYAASGLDRAAERRRDEAWLRARRADPRSRRLVLSTLKLAVTGEETEPRLATRSVGEHGPAGDDTVFLGLGADGAAWFAEAGEEAASGGRVIDLRAVGLLLSAAEAGTAAYARALLHWHAVTGFCASCGGRTEVAQGGHARHCPACGRDHFPRTDPAVIVLITHGERCLLGRSPRFPPGMYSTLAGFVEPGESLESCLAREVFEESGIEVDAIAYRASQPWPFPQSLMLGFRAAARTTEIRIDADELEDARWIERGDLRDPERRPVRLPNADSIARFLIEEWLAEG